jgi:hypothetical protein
MEYKNHTIIKFTPENSRRNYYRIYLNDEFKQTASSMKNAKHSIDFWTKEDTK